jgi:hypothetical protein
MVTKVDDTKAIIRELLTEDNLCNIKSRTIYRDGLEIQITRTDDGSIRFDLPDQGKSYVLMSGRLYERQYNQQNAESEEPEEEPGKKEGLTFTEIEERPAFAEQLNYKGEVESVDTRIFNNRITCECGNVRWIKSSDRFQVRHCKPCAQKKRRERRKIKKVAA